MRSKLLNGGFFLSFLFLYIVGPHFFPAIQPYGKTFALFTGAYYLLSGGEISRKYILLLICVVLGFFIAQIFRQISFYGFLNYIASALLAKIIVDGLIKPRTTLILVLSLLFVFCWRGFVQGLDVDEWAIHASRNNIGYVAVLILTLHYLVSFIADAKRLPEIYLAVVVFLFSIYASGRSGIASAGLLFFIVFLYRLYNANTGKRLMVALVLFVVICLVGYLFVNYVWSDGLLGASWDRFSVADEDVRWEIFRTFIETYGLSNLVTGFDLNSIPVVESLSGNPHNSYIDFLSVAGMGAVVFWCVLAYAASRLFFSRHRMMLFFSFPFFFRIFFDSDGFASLSLTISFFLILKGLDAKLFIRSSNSDGVKRYMYGSS